MFSSSESATLVMAWRVKAPRQSLTCSMASSLAAAGLVLVAVMVAVSSLQVNFYLSLSAHLLPTQLRGLDHLQL